MSQATAEQVQKAFGLQWIPGAVWDIARDKYVLLSGLTDRTGSPILLDVCGERIEGSSPEEAYARALEMWEARSRLLRISRPMFVRVS